MIKITEGTVTQLPNKRWTFEVSVYTFIMCPVPSLWNWDTEAQAERALARFLIAVRASEWVK